jgi:hypothetical protein
MVKEGWQGGVGRRLENKKEDRKSIVKWPPIAVPVQKFTPA